MIQTPTQLIDAIAADIVWRRKELTDLRAMVQDFQGELRSKVLIRCAIALLYAHWEGFVKKSSSYYLEYVASHRLPYKNLASNFVGLTIKAKYAELNVSKKISGGNALAEFFCSDLNKQSNIPYKNVVDTKSNLSSEVLADILQALGLEIAPFSTRLKFLDSNLVNPRNHVAHGEHLHISVIEYLRLHEDVISLIEAFRTELENASVLKRYERK